MCVMHIYNIVVYNKSGNVAYNSEIEKYVHVVWSD